VAPQAEGADPDVAEDSQGVLVGVVLLRSLDPPVAEVRRHRHQCGGHPVGLDGWVGHPTALPSADGGGDALDVLAAGAELHVVDLGIDAGEPLEDGEEDGVPPVGLEVAADGLVQRRHRIQAAKLRSRYGTVDLHPHLPAHRTEDLHLGGKVRVEAAPGDACLRDDLLDVRVDVAAPLEYPPRGVEQGPASAVAASVPAFLVGAAPRRGGSDGCPSAASPGSAGAVPVTARVRRRGRLLRAGHPIILPYRPRPS
jgi:hypothetical protein